MRTLLAAIAGLVLFFCAAPARAGYLRITTDDGIPWARLIEKIQEEVESEGRYYRIVVHDGEALVRCDEYELTLDPVAAAAFRIESCDNASSTTLLKLVRREALFEEGEIVPRARTASITASIVRRGSEEGGGGPPVAGSKIWCSVALQPYLWDGLRGRPVPLMPDRFVLRPVETHIQAAPDGAGWIARGESQFALRFHYVVTDARTGTKVLENEASLVCADAPAGQSSPAAACTGGSTSDPVGTPIADAPPPEPAPPKWTWSLDIPLPYTATFVASMLVQPLRGVVFPDGTKASDLYGGQAAGVYGGSTVGFTHTRGPLVVPMRFTLAADGHALAISGLAGVGVGGSIGNTTLLAVPSLRFTTLHNFDSGSWNHFDPAALFGVRHRLWMRGCNAGWDLFAEVGVPLGGTGAWLASAGITQSWGPGSSYFFGGCPFGSKKKKR